MTRERFEQLVGEAFDLRHSPMFCQAVVEELLVEWDRGLRGHQTLLAVHRVLRETDPARRSGVRDLTPEGEARAA